MRRPVLRRSTLVAALAAAAMLIGGCSGVPGSSAPDVVRSIDDGDLANVPAPRGPLAGDDERAIVAGFLRANVSTDLRHTSARQYLTAEAQRTWQDSPVTIVEDLPGEAFPDRPWGPGDNPKTAVWKYLEENADFEIDRQLQNKLLITVAPDGYLRRVR